MNPYELLIPQLLAGAAIVVIALRAVRQSRAETEAHDQRLAKRRAELAHHLAQVKEAIAHPDVPASTFVTAWADPPAGPPETVRED